MKARDKQFAFWIVMASLAFIAFLDNPSRWFCASIYVVAGLKAAWMAFVEEVKHEQELQSTVDQGAGEAR